jgi:NADH:ubiquinone oxidoreductase subunit
MRGITRLRIGDSLPHSQAIRYSAAFVLSGWTRTNPGAIFRPDEKYVNGVQPLQRAAMKQRISFNTYMSNLQIRLFTWRRGQLVGTDQFGNTYYRDKKATGRRERRWVLYNGEPEASKVPAEWHGWLHHTVKDPLKEGSAFHKPWQKPHIPNATGSLSAYRPPGHTLEGGLRERATGDYEPWTPG